MEIFQANVSGRFPSAGVDLKHGAQVDKTHLLCDRIDNVFTYSRHPNGVDTDQRSDWVFGK
ncbi:hypothetical protein [Methanocrinis sp.]|uniref:hypothetical protein n=1 Tax=Methanocrinis sp. TaxID=3101522 RepID=UPI003D11600B